MSNLNLVLPKFEVNVEAFLHALCCEVQGLQPRVKFTLGVHFSYQRGKFFELGTKEKFDFQ